MRWAAGALGLAALVWVAMSLWDEYQKHALTRRVIRDLTASLGRRPAGYEVEDETVRRLARGTRCPAELNGYEDWCQSGPGDDECE